MKARPFAAAAFVSLVLVLAGCTTPDPVPTPTAPAFSSDEAAFAAAEATYRAYVDALNQVDLADPWTAEPVFRLTSGVANANERTNYSEMHARKWAKSGATELVSFSGQEFNAQEQTAMALACIDVSRVMLADADGQSMVSPDRPPRYALLVTSEVAAGEPLPLITTSNAIVDESCV